MNEKLALFFYENYPTAKEFLSFNSCLIMVKNFHKVYRLKKTGEISFLALYLKVSDEMLQKIELLKNINERENFIKECLSQNGNNRICMYCVGSGKVNILSCLKELSIGATSVSWYRNDMNKLHKIKLRRQLCQSHY